LDIINAYEETGSLRAAAALCGTTHKTVKRVLQRRAAGQRGGSRFQAKRRNRKENPRSTDDLRHRALKIAKLPNSAERPI